MNGSLTTKVAEPEIFMCINFIILLLIIYHEMLINDIEFD